MEITSDTITIIGAVVGIITTLIIAFGGLWKVLAESKKIKLVTKTDLKTAEMILAEKVNQMAMGVAKLQSEKITRLNTRLDDMNECVEFCRVENLMLKEIIHTLFITLEDALHDLRNANGNKISVDDFVTALEKAIADAKQAYFDRLEEDRSE